MSKYCFIQRGEGRDLVMLHGYLSNKESFTPQIEYFSKFYRVTVPDFPGMGGANALGCPFSVDDYTDWTEGFLKEQGIVNPLVIAHSFGGRVAVKLLARGRVDRAVLTGCAGIVRKRALRYKMKVRAYRIVKKLAPKYAETHFGSTEYRTLSPVMRESYKKIVNEDLREEAKTITRPVLFVCGSEDRETPLSSAQIYHACVKDSRLIVLERCGHFAHIENPLAFNAAAEEFFS